MQQYKGCKNAKDIKKKHQNRQLPELVFFIYNPAKQGLYLDGTVPTPKPL